MASPALRYCVLSLLCHVGFAAEDGYDDGYDDTSRPASQQDCFRVMDDEFDLDFSEATLRSNNLGGMGPGPGQCNASLPAGDPGQSQRCGFTDLDPTHPYYNKMGASLYSSTHAALTDACRIRSGASWCGSFRQRRERSYLP